MKIEKIKEISGIEAKPFFRLNTSVPLDHLLKLLNDAKKEAAKKGYSNPFLHITNDSSNLDILLFGEREATSEEINQHEEMLVLGRMLERTSEGLNRSEILERNRNIC
jgi:hypothetical protein